MKFAQRWAGVWVLLAALPLAAQDDPAAPPEIAEPPPIPPKVQGEQIEPTVRIHRDEEQIVEEYILNGRVYMVKITPKRGKPYYYLDEDGDGTLELQPGDEAMNPVRPAYWKVKEWH